MAGFKERVEALVRGSHAGNVSAAASAIGVPQRTLARIVAGTTPQPRADVVQKLAKFYRVPMEWLLSGEGEAPPVLVHPMLLMGERLQWYELLDRLKLPGDVYTALDKLPESTADAARLWGFDKLGRGTEAPYKKSPTAKMKTVISPAVFEALRLEYLSWGTLFHDWIDAVGVERVREQVLKDRDAIAARFSGPGGV